MKIRCAPARQLLIITMMAVAAGALLCLSASAQSPDIKITVDSVPLGASPAPIFRQGEWWVPMKAIARSLSAEVDDITAPDSVTVRRANGREYTVHLPTGEIRSGYVLIGRIPPAPTPLLRVSDDLMFPLRGIVVLFGVSAEEDAHRATIVIERSRDDSARGSATADANDPMFHLLGLNYSYGFTTNGRDSGQIGHVEGDGLMGGVGLRGTLETSQVPGHSLVETAYASLRMQFNPQAAVLLGDQSTYSGMDALVLSVRGVGYEGKLRGFSSYYFAGRGRGPTTTSFGTTGVSQFDTTIGGFSLRQQTRERDRIFAGNVFSGTSRKGITLGGAYSRRHTRNYFRIEALAGRFSGASTERVVDGFGYGFTLLDTFSPRTDLEITAETEHYSPNFLTAQNDARFTGQTNNSVGAVYRPLSALSLSGGLTDQVRAGRDGRTSAINYGAQYVLRRSTSVLLGYFRNATYDRASSSRFSITRYSVDVPAFNRYSFSVQYSDINNGASLVRDLMFLAARTTSSWGRFSAHGHLQSAFSHRYGLDWMLNAGPRGSYIQLGADYIRNSYQELTAPRVTVRLPFLRGQALHLRYTREPGNNIFQFEVMGPLIDGRKVERSSNGGNLVVRPSNLKGRVYFDTDNNGHYDGSVDRPLSGLRLSLDGIATSTDADGMFDFKQVAPGAHRLRADLSGVPADLAMADAGERTVAVIPYADNVENFRVLRMGRVTGRVTYLDTSAESESPVERPLPDVRVVVSARVDTYTSAEGFFIAGDLVPGDYRLTVDPTTIPDGYVARPESVVVAVKPGEQQDGIRFVIVPAPRPVIERTLEPQEIR